MELSSNGHLYISKATSILIKHIATFSNETCQLFKKLDLGVLAHFPEQTQKYFLTETNRMTIKMTIVLHIISQVTTCFFQLRHCTFPFKINLHSNSSAVLINRSRSFNRNKLRITGKQI